MIEGMNAIAALAACIGLALASPAAAETKTKVITKIACDSDREAAMEKTPAFHELFSGQTRDQYDVDVVLDPDYFKNIRRDRLTPGMMGLSMNAPNTYIYIGPDCRISAYSPDPVLPG